MVLLNAGTNGTTWVQPKNLHEEVITEQPVGQIFWSISNGIRNMAGYASQIRLEDRWAIVAWVKALQYSQNAPVERAGADTFPVRPKVEPGEGMRHEAGRPSRDNLALGASAGKVSSVPA